MNTLFSILYYVFAFSENNRNELDYVVKQSPEISHKGSVPQIIRLKSVSQIIRLES